MIVFPFLLLVNSFACKSVNIGNRTLQDSIYAKYEHYTHDKRASTILALYKNGTYYYTIGPHLEQLNSTGTWRIIKDTLVLNSFVQKDDLPITVNTGIGVTNPGLVEVSLVRNLKGDLIKDAQIFINGDTSKYCMPAFENDCKFSSNEIKNIQVRLSNNITSKWTDINSSNIQRLSVMVNLDYQLGLSILFKEEKYIIKRKKLYKIDKKAIVFNNKPAIVLVRNNNNPLIKSANY